MIRARIQFETEMYQHLKKAAQDSGCSIAEVVRASVRKSLNGSRTAQKWRDSQSIVGKYRSGLGNLAEKHDEYLDDDW